MTYLGTSSGDNRPRGSTEAERDHLKGVSARRLAYPSLLMDRP